LGKKLQGLQKSVATGRNIKASAAGKRIGAAGKDGKGGHHPGEESGCADGVHILAWQDLSGEAVLGITSTAG